ncbi:hypothetical protein J2N86_15950 (plasmid) [Legionella lytica]|uniref:Uncharacterized protein n=1 Tax=Legionella lytica TaxID=96232 RepID=A0ABY4YEF3_9GAMM|nr:hypothetical protein [Legionella lytica]USQ15517.1 hypothetical protein J2N86_15950 [Legionella lytica]
MNIVNRFDTVSYLALIILLTGFMSYPAQSARSISFVGKHMLHRPTKTNRGKFLTGVAVGSLLFSQKSGSESDNVDYSFNGFDELYAEYERNTQLLKKGSLSKEQQLTLIRRNEQIKIALVRKARNRYVESFTLQLTPLKEKIIDREKTESKRSPNTDQVIRKEIVYQIRLSRESPSTIDNFDVISVNDTKPNSLNPYQFNYSEQWGENVIKIKLRDKKDHGFEFELTKTYYVPQPKEKNPQRAFLPEIEDRFLYLAPLLVIWFSLRALLGPAE